MDSWQLKQILKLYIYFVVKTTSSVKLFEDFEVTLQKFHNGWNDFIAHVFVYKLCLQLCFSERWKKPHETFPISKKNFSLKMNANLKKELCIENERTF